MNPRASTLFHFTKSAETLKLILKGGFWPRYCQEDTRWVGQSDAQSVAFPMVCFCDIPLSRINEHVNFYGQYGLGMTREWAMSNGLNPVLYMAGENSLHSELRVLNDHANLLTEPARENAKATARYLYAYIKPVRGVMTVAGEVIEKDFYLESEWRFVPRNANIHPYLRNSIFEDQDRLDAENAKTYEHCRLAFTPKDVRYIFVQSDSDIPDMINFIQGDLDHFPNADVKVLMSRVTSLQSIRDDV